jgi:hypothetical protein
VKIEWNATKGYKLNDGVFTKIDTLEILGNLVGELNDKTGKGNENCFTLAFGGGVVKVCGGGNMDITTDANFETLLGYITTLKNTNKAINSIFKIKIAITQKAMGLILIPEMLIRIL